MKKFLHIKIDNGEIIQVAKIYGLVPSNLHNSKIENDTILLYEVEEGLDVDNWVNTKYYKNGEFLTKPIKPANGIYTFENYQWVVDSTQVQQTMRFQRDDRLSISDWRMMPDSTLTSDQRTAWGTYRQALRDLPSSYPNLTDLNDIVWPTEPS